VKLSSIGGEEREMFQQSDVLPCVEWIVLSLFINELILFINNKQA
jgi:hypothetical protein